MWRWTARQQVQTSDIHIFSIYVEIRVLFILYNIIWLRINIKAENRATAKNGKIKITKELRTDDKTDVSDVKDKFEFAITIFYDDPTKLFTYNGKEYNSLTISETIKGAGSTTTSDITWYDNEAPRYSIKEVSIPNSWRFLKFDGSPSGTLSVGTINAKCINEQIIDRKYYFTMELGGKVWNDTVFQSGKPVDTANNGKIDDNVRGKEVAYL